MLDNKRLKEICKQLLEIQTELRNDWGALSVTDKRVQCHPKTFMQKVLTPFIKGRPESKYPIELSCNVGEVCFFTILNNDEIFEAVASGYLQAKDVQDALFVELRTALDRIKRLSPFAGGDNDETRSVEALKQRGVNSAWSCT